MSADGVLIERGWSERPQSFRVAATRFATLDVRAQAPRRADDLIVLATVWVSSLVVAVAAFTQLRGAPALIVGSTMALVAFVSALLLASQLLRSTRLRLDGDTLSVQSRRFGVGRMRCLPRIEIEEVESERDGEWHVVARARDGQRYRLLTVGYAEQAETIREALRETLAAEETL